MAEVFEGRDLADAVFWGVDLRRALVRDADLTGLRVTHALVEDVSIDAVVDRLVVNGVDVTEHVNAHDRWYPLRVLVRPRDADGARAGWAALQEAWAALLGRAAAQQEERRHQRVDGEWSLVETLRHLLFATDKWFTQPVLGGDVHPWGLAHTGADETTRAGLDPDAAPSWDDVLAARAGRGDAFGGWLRDLDDATLAGEVDVLENGRVTVLDCVLTVLEEEFWHLRYADRDLAVLEGAA